MAVVGIMLMLAAQTGNSPQPPGNPWEKYRQKPPVEQERLGPGPHVLVITSEPPVRINYKTGAACQRARDEVRRQMRKPDRPGVIYGEPTILALCVPL